MGYVNKVDQRRKLVVNWTQDQMIEVLCLWNESSSWQLETNGVNKN